MVVAAPAVVVAVETDVQTADSVAVAAAVTPQKWISGQSPQKCPIQILAIL